ncbi:MAG: cupin domain-containing protein [Lachnospiraceae bacterium]|nr:cupin domain-containing protein [Lachnospiraceae bacterium]
MKIPYRVRMREPEDCIAYTNNNGIQHYDFFHPVGPVQKNEMDCMEFASPETQDIGYHEHSYGCETFFVVNGKIECCVLGEKVILGPGDILHIQPYMGHSFKPASENARMNIMFQGLDMANSTARRFRVQRNFPGRWEDPDLQKKLLEIYGGAPRTFPNAPYVEPEAVSAVRVKDSALKIHEREGLTMKLKIGRWEMHGVKEVWEAIMEKGLKVEHPAIRPEQYFYYITEGKLLFRVWENADHYCEFEAEKDTLVQIPTCLPFEFEVLEPSKMFDLDCQILLQDYFEEIERLEAFEPEKLQDEEHMKMLRERFNYWYDFVGFKK